MSKERAEDFKNTPGMRTEERMSRLREDAGRARREALQQLRTGPRELDQPLPTGSHDLAQELRRETAAGILRREDLSAAAAMELDGGEECPHELVLVNRGTNMTIETIKAMLRAVRFVIKTFKITAPEAKADAKKWILQSVSRILIQAKDVVFDPESDKLLDEISDLLDQDIRPLSLAYGCQVIKDGSIKIINALRDNIKRVFNQYIERERRAKAYVNETTSEDPNERSRIEDAERDAVMAAQVGVLMEGLESETEDAMKSRNNPMFAIGRKEGPPTTRAERLKAARERNKRRIQMEAQQRLAALQRDAPMGAAEEDSDAEEESSSEIGGKRRTRKHKKQMKHKKTKRHRKNTKKNLKKRNNKKQRKTRNRK